MFKPLYELPATVDKAEMLDILVKINEAETIPMEARIKANNVLKNMLKLITNDSSLLSSYPTLTEVMTKAIALETYSHMIPLIAEVILLTENEVETTEAGAKVVTKEKVHKYSNDLVNMASTGIKQLLYINEESI